MVLAMAMSADGAAESAPPLVRYRSTYPPQPKWEGLLTSIGITSTLIFDQVRGAVEQGSGDAVFSWYDFTFTVAHGNTADGTEETRRLIELGMQPLDAIVWRNGKDRPLGFTIEPRDADVEESPSPSEMCSEFFAWYFCFFTQGKAVGEGDPSFLVEVLSMGEEWQNKIKRLTSANIYNFPKYWVRLVSFGTLSTKARNRLALGA